MLYLAVAGTVAGMIVAAFNDTFLFFLIVCIGTFVGTFLGAVIGGDRSRRKTAEVVLVVLSCAGVLLGFALPFFPSGPVNRENFEQINLGMTEQEVEELLGPKGDYSTHHIEWAGRAADWVTNHALVWVQFDRDGRVTWKEFSARPYHTFAGLVYRSWFGLPNG